MLQGFHKLVACAILFNGVGVMTTRVAHAQEVGEESFSSEEVTVAMEAQSGWKVNRMSRSQFDRIKATAKDDTKFGKIRDYLDGTNKWKQFHNSGWKFYKEDNMIRKGYSIQYRHCDTQALAVVQYTVEANGRIDRVGYIWRNSEVADRIYVKNGNVRTENRDAVHAQEVDVSGLDDGMDVGKAPTCILPLAFSPA